MASSLYFLNCEIEKNAKEAAERAKHQFSHETRFVSALKEIEAGDSTLELQQFVQEKVQSDIEHKKSGDVESEELLEELKSNFFETLRFYAYCYDKTKNVLFLWRIYSLYRIAGRPLPHLIYAYFDLCAQNLFCSVYDLPLESIIQKKSSSARRNEYAGEDCMRALNLHQKGQLNAFASMKKYMAKLFLMIDIEEAEKKELAENTLPEKAESNAIRFVHIMQEKSFGNKAISHNTLYKYYQEYKKNGKLSDFWR